ncbi:hypothetical protein E4U32_006597 [Claviceps aff. humidiphila group G2b]|nr:hypothetical protein E4U32_006597 [Claviceps aff. humidiphila group G2b]
MQAPDEATFNGTDIPMNDSSNDATVVSDENNGLGTNVFHEEPPMTIEETIPERSPAMRSPHEATFQGIGTPMNESSNDAIGVSDGTNQFWRGTFLENPPMTIEETIPEMGPAMQSPSEAASDATSMAMNNSIDAEVTTTNSTFERVWELMGGLLQGRLSDTFPLGLRLSSQGALSGFLKIDSVASVCVSCGIIIALKQW